NQRTGYSAVATVIPGDALPRVMHAPPRHLFACWGSVSARIRSAPCVALFLDFDGTLTPLQPRPEGVRLGASVRRTIQSLGRDPRVRVCVISGRRRQDVRQRVRIPGIRYLGLHGWEGHGTQVLDQETHRVLDEIKTIIGKIAIKAPGAWVEDKGPVV